jgi:tripartite-type tricarboxylate transporter receptor subunit TctC
MFAKRAILLAVTAVASFLYAEVSASAQSYPTRPITMIVGAAAGGPTDTIGRIIAERMRVSLGQTIIIENNGSAAGSIAHGRVARAADDGYTLSLGHLGTHVYNGVVYLLPYDVLADFEPVSLISDTPFLFAARSGLPADDLKGLLGWLKANANKALLGTAGAGSPPHIGGVFLESITGANWQYVPYRGALPAMQGLMGGEVDWELTTPDTGLPQMRAGRIKVFAVTARTRLTTAPDIPTTDEAGLPGFYLSYWHGLWARRGTPKDVVSKLNSALVDALANPAVRARLADLGQEIFPREQQTPEALAALQKTEIDKWWPIIKAAGIKPE